MAPSGSKNLKSRREFFKAAAAAGVLGSLALPLGVPAQTNMTPAPQPGDDRAYWVAVLNRIATPVLENLARRELRARMPVEARPGTQRAGVTHLEAFGRLLAGLAPWLGAPGLTGSELALEAEFWLRRLPAGCQKCHNCDIHRGELVCFNRHRECLRNRRRAAP